MRCKCPVRIETDNYVAYVPCGQCINCRLNYARMWSLRCQHEATQYGLLNSFITLTFDEDHVPVDGSIRKRDLQLFFKRFRKSLGKKCRYFACGEYGDKFGRPHYHAIIFGVGVDDPVYRNPRYDRQARGYWVNLDAWPFGHVFVGYVTADSANYVAGYVVKKQTGKTGEEYYKQLGVEPPFCLMSRRPGIGAGFLEKNSEQLAGLGYAWYKSHKIGLPRYYQDKLADFLTKNHDCKIYDQVLKDIEASRERGVSLSTYQMEQAEQAHLNYNRKGELYDKN